MGYALAASLKSTTSADSFPSRGFTQGARPFNVVIASAVPEIIVGLTNILERCSVKVVFAKGLEELKSACSEAAPIACLCGFDLVDGAFHEVVEQLDQQPIPIPVVMVSPPTTIGAPAGFLDSLRFGAFATICYPYRASAVQITLWSAIQCQREWGRLPLSAGAPASQRPT